MSISNCPCLLFDLPYEVVGEILGDWLELQSLVRVDSAVCNFSGRQSLLKLFASKKCVQRRTVIMNTDSCARWFSKRKVLLTQVALAVASQEISKCLRLNSKSIWYVDCSESVAIDLVAMECRNLKYFMLKALETNPNLNAALAYNVNLQELRVAKHCPQLRSIGLDELPITDVGLEILTRLCPHIDNLRLNNHELVTDAGLLCVAKNLTELRSLDLAYCDITDLSLKHLTTHCRMTLDTLYIIGMQHVRVDVLVHLLQQCGKLRSLCLDCDIGSHYDDVVPHMCNLRSLLLYSTLSDDCLCSIARHCKQLQHLGIPCSFKVDTDLAAVADEAVVELGAGGMRILLCAEEDTTGEVPTYTDKGLLALVDGLSSLQRLRAPAVSADSGENTLLHTMARCMWQRLRPGLQFEQDESSFYHNILDGTV